MIRIFTLLAFTVLTVFQGFSQSHVNYDRDSRWFIGLNAGGTWTTQTEVDYRIRGGYGLTFGKSFGMEHDKIFSWDLRARFLHAQVAGQSSNRYALDSTSSIGLNQYGAPLQTYQDSLGYFIPNYKTNLLRGSIELVLNTNRLRQNTGWNLSVFGGLGITGYHTATNLLDDDNLTFDYDQLKNPSAVKIKNFQDEFHETDVVGNAFDYDVDWMPSFGFGISKQVHPAIAIGIEHKMTWTRTNLFDAMTNNMDGTASNINDKYHYTALTVKFHLFGNKYVEEDPIVEDDFDEPDTDPIIDPVSRKKPIVDIYDPNSSTHTTTQNTFRIKANVYYVDSKSDITFKQDGNYNTNFSFNPSTNQFESRVILHPGQNLFEITGVNESGSDYESVIIIYQKEEEKINPPIVTITNPPYTPYTTTSSIFGLASTVLNVDSKSQIRVYLNGVNLAAFSYNNSSKAVNASLNLNEGTNTITVTGTNDAGSDSKTVQIIYRKENTLQPPIVNFVNPSVDPYSTTASTINIRATALHVEAKSDLTVKVNGNPIGGYSFNTATKEIYFSTSLIIGANNIEIIGVNNAGTDIATTTIVYARPQTPKPPIVTFIDPNINPVTVYEASYNVEAKVQNVSSAAYITLKINGVTSTSFTYSTSSDLMNFTTSLVEGSNVIEITGRNKLGTDIESTTIIYKRTIPKAPPIVNITYPAVDNIEFASPNITLLATLLNVAEKADITVMVNGVITDGFSYNTYTKDLNLPLVLEEGNNIIQITGVNMAGSDSKTRIIKYKRPVVPCPPTVNFINPPTSPHVSALEAFTVTANTTHIDSKSQIVFKQNGVLISDALYSFVGGDQIIYNATLIAGSNIFEVSVENADGSDTDLAIVNFEKDDEPCLIPTVGYISPVPYSTVEDPNVTIDAQINNHSDGTTIELKLNGISQGFMGYNAETSIASKSIVLLSGSNAINVVVTNECGTNQATFTLIYEAPDAPCYDPTIVASGSSSFTTLEETVNLIAVSTHIADATELTVKLNGVVIPFSFDAGTGLITISDINLLVGSNAVAITAKTDCGGAVLVYSIIREECKAPVISEVTPLTGASTEASTINVNATITNATTSDIVLLLNGISQSFSYNEETNILSQALTLGIGSNAIQIQVENACGSNVKRMTVTREIPCESIVTSLLSPTASTVTSTEELYSISLHAGGIDNVDQVNATLNGAAISPSFDAVSGNITLTSLPLIDGENTVIVTMKNECSESTVTYNITYDGCKAPIIVINGIYPGMVVTEGVFSLAVIITNVNDASDIVLLINGLPIDFDYNPITNLLSAEFPLLKGDNIIDIQVDGCEKASATASLVYEVPCDVITHTLMEPNVIPTVSVESEFEITLSTFGLESAEQISVKLNGVIIPFSYNTATKIIKIENIDLIDGTNTVIVSMKNECSSDLVNYSIIYDGCNAPVITLGINPTEVTEELYDFEANVSNITDAADIFVLLNSAPVAFVFDPSSGAVDASFKLPKGDNTIKILANGCEKANKKLKVNYSIPCKPITYTLSSPTALSTKVADATYNISLIVQNATYGDISVVRGPSTLSFTYVDNVLSINGIKLNDGINTIVVNIANDCSKETITYLIDHEDCNSPEIDLSKNALTTELASYAFVASLTNIEKPDQIKVLVGGVSNPFTFDPISGALNATLTLVEGENNISITAHGCAEASDKIQVSYKVPCPKVTYSLASPNTLISVSAEEAISISLNTEHVTAAEISAQLNGKAIDFTFTGGVITIPTVPLVEGANSVTISFGNDCSKETITYTIEHDHCDIPVIIINGLTDGAVLVEQELVFFANISNVEDAGDITLRFNGVAVGFTYNPESDLLETPLTLNKGDNEIEIIVNGCERVTGGVDLVYEEPCAAPSYTLVVPTETTVTVEGDAYTITLNVENVLKEQVSVKLNGASIPFTFSSGTVIFEAPYISVPTNTVIVTLENDCGTATASYAITYILEEEDCVPTVSALFAVDNKSTTVTSDKDLMNVILNLDDGSTQLIEDVTGKTGTFSPIGEKADRCIVGVWIRAGCNLSAAGEPFGDYVVNPTWDGNCELPCSPITYTLVSPNRFSTGSVVEIFTIIFNTTNLSGPDDIIALVNDIPTEISYVDGQVTLASIKLKAGTNRVRFTLSNDCSTEVLNYTITHGFVDGIVPGGDEDGGKDGLIDEDDGGKKQELKTPVISPINPTTTRATVKVQTFSLKAQITNIRGKADIEVLVNGVKFSAFNYSTNSEKLSAIIRLNPGVNSIKIKANNGLKTERTYYITYKKDAQKIDNGGKGNLGETKGELIPKLTRISPASSSSKTDKSTFILKVKTTNVMSKSGLTLTVNGARITNFTFSSSTKIMSAVIRLRAGSNAVRIDAKNGAKKTSLTYNIIYAKAQNKDNGQKNNNNNGGGVQVSDKKPVFKKVSPTTTSKTVTKATFVLKTNIKNVKSKANITLTVNGVKITTFTFNSSTGSLVATLKLKSGANAIRISAKNGNQVATTSYAIKYQAPVIKQSGSGGGKKLGEPTKTEGGKQQNGGGVRRGG